MSRSKVYTIPYDPIPWQRAGISKTNHRFYDRQVHDKISVGLILGNQHGNEPLFEAPIIITLDFIFKKPKTHKTIISHAVKPDIDNLIKFILDTMKDIIISDDKIITSITAFKKYALAPQTIITITEL